MVLQKKKEQKLIETRVVIRHRQRSAHALLGMQKYLIVREKETLGMTFAPKTCVNTRRIASSTLPLLIRGTNERRKIGYATSCAGVMGTPGESGMWS